METPRVFTDGCHSNATSRLKEIVGRVDIRNICLAHRTSDVLEHLGLLAEILLGSSTLNFVTIDGACGADLHTLLSLLVSVRSNRFIRQMFFACVFDVVRGI